MPLPVEVITFAERGWMLTPLRQNNKIPLLTDWPTLNRTSNIEILEQWSVLFPGCNWGMVTGPASGICVLDIDLKNGKQGLDWYNHQLLEHGVEWQDTLRVRTASGGYHNYYQWSDGIGKNTSGSLANGVDIIGEGGQVVVPGSIVNGVAYKFEDCDGEKSIAPLPGWLAEVVLRAFQPPPAPPPVRVNGEGRIPEGQRHLFLLRHAGQLLHQGISFQALQTELLTVNNYHFQVPYPEPEIQRQVADFYGRWQRDPKAIWREFQASYTQGNKQEIAVSLETQEGLLQEVEVMAIEWLPGWEPYIALGTLTLLTGDPGVGKSFIALAIAAQLTRDGHNVAYLSVENPAAYIVRPRFDALGGDPGKVVLVKGLTTPDGKRSITLEDIQPLEKMIERHHIKLMIIDPVQSYLGAHIDAYRFNETRPVLDGLVDLAERHMVAILILRHVVKMGGNRAIHKGLGSIDFTGAVRSELFAGETVDHARRGMVHIKSNLGSLGRALGYEISQSDQAGRIWQAGYFRWTGTSELKVSDLTEPESKKLEEGALREAKDFLLQALADGCRLQAEVQEEAYGVGIRERTLRRAKKELNVQSLKRVDKKWEWFLPKQDGH